MAPSFLAQIEKGDKNSSIMKSLISYLVNNSASTIPELAKELGFSVPTVTKVVNELAAVGLIAEYGQVEGHSGRRPVLYGFNRHSGYFLGLDVKRESLNVAIVDFMGEIVDFEMGHPLTVNISAEAAIDEICDFVNQFIDEAVISRDKIYYGCVALSGRVNANTGFSFSVLSSPEQALNDIFTERLRIPMCIDNDSRVMTYGEYLCGKLAKNEKEVLYVNLSWGLGMGVIINGQIVKGRSGYAGELGHFPAYNNEIMCHCGKKGCLETGVSGMALMRDVVSSINAGKQSLLCEKMQAEGVDSLTLADIIAAVDNEDILCIEVVENMATELGRWLAGLINMFNPELVIVGGTLASLGDYLLRPVKQSVQKYTLRLVSQDSRIVVSKLGEKAGVLGAALYARHRILFDNN